jgi:hypothetical protein
MSATFGSLPKEVVDYIRDTFGKANYKVSR